MFRIFENCLNFLFLFFFLFSFWGFVCISHCSGGLCLEVVVVVLTCFCAFAGGEITFVFEDGCVHPEAFDERGSSWKEKVCDTLAPRHDFRVDSLFEATCVCTVIEVASALY